MMGHRSTEESRYQAILPGEGCMKILFKTIKSAGGGHGLGRVFITGVSPVAMSDLTSGYNVAENIYLLPHFNALCGFREDEIAAAKTQIAGECDLAPTKADEAVEMMRIFYNGYRFSPDAEHTSIIRPSPCIFSRPSGAIAAIRKRSWTAIWPWTGASCITSPAYQKVVG